LWTVLAAALFVPGCADPVKPSPRPAELRVTQVSPSSGPTESTIPVTIRGQGFAAGATVTVAGAAVAATLVDSGTISTVVPPHPAGSVNIVVTNPGGASATLTGGFTYVPVAVTSVSPTVGNKGTDVTIVGTGFLTGATVTLGGVRADVRLVTGTSISATAPEHADGLVDVVVTNPGGQSGTMVEAFRYQAAELTASPALVTAGSTITVSWLVRVLGFDDWIGIFRVGEPNTSYLNYKYVGGASGTVTFPAPSAPGQYEFRYLPNDGYNDIARSNIVTVTAVDSISSSALSARTTSTRDARAAGITTRESPRRPGP
jgi:hypothetical protein